MPTQSAPVGFNLLVMNPVDNRLKRIGYDGVECTLDNRPLAVRRIKRVATACQRTLVAN